MCETAKVQWRRGRQLRQGRSKGSVDALSLELPAEGLADTLDSRVNIRQEGMVELVRLSNKLAVEQNLRRLGRFGTEQVYQNRKEKSTSGQYERKRNEDEGD